MYPNMLQSNSFKKIKKNYKAGNEEKPNTTKEKEEQKERDQNILNKMENL